jgi:hypothetical protein
MPKPLDLTGKTVGYLKVLRRAHNTQHGTAQWGAKCACGAVVMGLGLGGHTHVSDYACV